MFHCLWLLMLGTMAVANGDLVTEAMETNAEKSDNYTIVVFGTNPNNVEVLVSLLSNDGQLVVQKDNEKIIIVNPANAGWSPDPKYHICHKVQPKSIPDCLNNLVKPFRFVVAFDYTDMFMDPFWEMLFYLADNVSQDKVYSNQLQLVAMNVPHDGVSFGQRIDELKMSIKNALKNAYTVDFQIVGINVIEKSGPVSKMPELLDELVVIKSTVDQ